MKDDCSWLAVGGMIDAVICWNWSEVVRIHAFEAANVVPILVGIGSALMMSVDTAEGAKEVLRRSCIELVNLQDLSALQDLHAGYWNRRDDCSSSPAK